MLLALTAVGLTVMARWQPRLAAILVLAVVVTLAASALKLYPFRSRLILFLAPLVPLALARERELLATLEADLAAAFLEALARLESALQLPRAESAPQAGRPAGSRRAAGKASGRAARSP